jgi:hypothetical protein
VSRYFTQPRADKPLFVETPLWSEDRQSFLPDLDVPDHKPRDTGLLDQSGNPIMRGPRPIGFGRDGEW